MALCFRRRRARQRRVASTAHRARPQAPIHASAFAPGRQTPPRAAGTSAASPRLRPRRSSPRHQLGPGLHRALRHSGQLQRLPGVGHLRSTPSHARTAYFCPARRATCRSTGICCSSPGRPSRPHRLRDGGRAGHRQQGPVARHSHLRHHRHRATRNTSATCRRAAARTRTRWWSIRGSRRTSTSTSRARPACDRQRAGGMLGLRRTRIRTRRCSASK